MTSIKTFLTLCAFLILVDDVQAQQARGLHRRATLIDAHNDFPSNGVSNGQLFDSDLRGKTHSDLNRMQAGGVDVQIFSIFCGPEQDKPYAWANREIDSVQAWVQRNPTKMSWVRNSKELKAAVKQGRLGTMLGVEGGHMMEDDLEKLRALYQRGVRYMTLTWNNSTTWASSAADETMRPTTLKEPGLNAFGEKVVQQMNELGMIIDVSHTGEKTFWEVIALTKKPIIASHSSAYAYCPHRRNLKDEQLRAIARNGGVVHVNFYAGFIDSTYEEKASKLRQRDSELVDSLIRTGLPANAARTMVAKTLESAYMAIRPPLSVLLDHIDHIVKIAGINHTGLGSDFDGIEAPPRELNGVENFPDITEGLLARGYSEKDIRKILGGNFIRVLKANERR